MSSGIEKFWVFARHNNGAYIGNKLLSFLVAAGLATVTALHKPML